MPDLIKGNRDTLPDHMTPDGDQVAATFGVIAVGEDQKPKWIIIVCWHASSAVSLNYGYVNANGQALLETEIDEEKYAFAQLLLDHAVDALMGYHLRHGQITIKGRDTSLPIAVENVVIQGPVEDRLLASAVMKSAKDALTNSYERKKLHRDKLIATGERTVAL